MNNRVDVDSIRFSRFHTVVSSENRRNFDPRIFGAARPTPRERVRIKLRTFSRPIALRFSSKVSYLFRLTFVNRGVPAKG